MTSETQCCDNVVTTLSDVPTKIQPKPNVATTSCAGWVTFRNRNFMLFRSSRPEVFCKKGVLWNFAKFIGKYLCQSLFLINLQAAPATLLKMRPWDRYFPVDFAKFLRTPFLQNTSGGCFSQMQTRKKGFVLKIKIWLRFSHQTQSAYSNKLIQEQLLLCFQHSTSLLITFD